MEVIGESNEEWSSRDNKKATALNVMKPSDSFNEEWDVSHHHDQTVD